MANSVIDCNNFFQIFEMDGKLINDFYTGQVIKLHIPKDQKKNPEVEWIGINSFKVPIMWGDASQKEGWVNFFLIIQMCMFFQRKRSTGPGREIRDSTFYWSNKR